MKLTDFTGMLQEARKVNSKYALAAFGVIAVIAIVILLLGRLKITTFDALQTLLLIGMLLLTLIILVIFGPRENQLGQNIEKPIIPPIVPPIHEPTVKFCNEGKDVETNLIDLLKKTEESLYYYGGAGFIGTFQDWQEELEKKIQSEKIIFVRLVDLKTPTEIKKVLKMMKKKKDVDRDYTKYTEWLEMHSKYLNISSMLNEFYNFEGAPLWRYGVHHIIFDKKHVAIVFLSAGEVRNAIIIRHCPDIAEALLDSIGLIVKIFDLTPITSKELEKVSGSRR